MLKKILELMYIEPELLAELDEEQKQLLFFKMREEQVRRWKLREDEIGDKDIKFPSNFTKKPRKPKGTLKVSFALERNSDKPHVTIIDECVSIIDQKTDKDVLPTNDKNNFISKESPRNKPSPNAKPKYLSGMKVGDSPRSSLMKQGSNRFAMDSLDLEGSSVKTKDAEDDKNIESDWKEQEFLIREHDEKKKFLLQKVRELGRSESTMDVRDSTKNLLPPPPSAPVSSSRNLGFFARPENKAFIVKWFKEHEVPRGAGLVPSTGRVAEWFHGIISREDSEKLLANKPVGSFLIRVSDKIWGYTVSYKSVEKCKHFLLDASPLSSTEEELKTVGPYRFFGARALAHDSLNNFVQHYRKMPISLSGCELLVNPCGQADPSKPDYAELFEK